MPPFPLLEVLVRGGGVGQREVGERPRPGVGGVDRNVEQKKGMDGDG